MLSRTIGCAVVVTMALAGGAAIAQQAPTSGLAAGSPPAAKAPASKPAASTPAAQGSQKQPEQPARVAGAGASGAQISDRRRREAIADLVKLQARSFRPWGPAILRNAQIAGPVEHRELFEGKSPHYCVRAYVETAALFSGTKTAVVKVEKLPNGEKLTLINTAPPAGCEGAYAPFPELEKWPTAQRQGPARRE
jgi:hypothetical protein